MISQYEKVVIQDGVYSIDYCFSQVQINFFLKPIFQKWYCTKHRFILIITSSLNNTEIRLKENHKHLWLSICIESDFCVEPCIYWSLVRIYCEWYISPDSLYLYRYILKTVEGYRC